MTDFKENKYAVQTIWSTIYRLFMWDKYLALLSVGGVVLTALPYYGVHLLEGFLMRTATEAANRGNSVWNIVVAIGILHCITRIPTILGYWLNSWAAFSLGSKMQTQLVNRWCRRDERNARNYYNGKVTSHILADASEIKDFFFQGLGLSVVEPFVIGIGGFITVMLIEWKFIPLLLLVGLLSTFCTTKLSKYIYSLSQESAEIKESAIQSLSTIFTAEQTIRNMGIREKELKTYNHAVSGFSWAKERLENTMKVCELVESIFQIVSLVGCILLAVWLSKNNHFYFADVMLILPMQTLISSMLGGIGKAWNCMTSVSVHASRVFDIMDIEQEDLRQDNPMIKYGEFKNVLLLDQVIFSYQKENDILQGVSLKVGKGKKVAIVGPSGSGKSTLFGIIMNYFLPEDGNVYLLDQLPEESSLSSWRDKIALIQQENSLFDISIADNISISNVRSGIVSDREAIEEAAKRANAHEFIESLPEGYDTMVGESGKHFSGGQRQRIALARAFLSEVPLILLDEPTSALDVENEKLFYQALKRTPQNQAVLIITHRLKYLKDFNKIYVLDKGQIVAEGTHDELVDGSSLYQELWKN